MKITEKAQAGSFESSDVLVIIEPSADQKGRQVEIKSSVMLHFGEDLKKEINLILDEYEIEDICMIVNDKGALVATLRARVETALKRAMGIQKGTL